MCSTTKRSLSVFIIEQAWITVAVNFWHVQEEGMSSSSGSAEAVVAKCALQWWILQHLLVLLDDAYPKVTFPSQVTLLLPTAAYFPAACVELKTLANRKWELSTWLRIAFPPSSLWTVSRTSVKLMKGSDGQISFRDSNQQTCFHSLSSCCVRAKPQELTC